MTPNTPDVTEQPAVPKSVQCSALLAAVKRLRDRWSDRANYMENLARYDGDAMAQLNKHHAKIIRTCISELYQEIEAANDKLTHSEPKAGGGTQQK